MEAREKLEERLRPATPGTLGEVLYGTGGKRLIPEGEWVDLVRRVGNADPIALHALYDRAHRVVFVLAVRITGNHETAEEVTLDVFHDVWRRASGYDPANGTVLGWIMNQARSRSIDRLRFEQRKKRLDPQAESDAAEADESLDPREILELKQQGSALKTAFAVLTPDERQAVECAFLTGLTHAEIAVRLNEPLGTVKTRIRSGLRKLRQAMGNP